MVAINFKKLTYLVGYNILEETFFLIKTTTTNLKLCQPYPLNVPMPTVSTDQKTEFQM